MFSTVLAAIAIFVAFTARSRNSELFERLRQTEHAIDVLRNEIGALLDSLRGGKPAAPAAPPAPETQKTTPQVTARKAAGEIASAKAGPGAPSIPVIGTPAAPSAAASAPAGRPAESFEEKLGARWAVWVGGAALALGGLFLVRYSIEAGLIGPGVRIALGALLAGVLIAGGEWIRRGEFKLPIDAMPEAHIPSVLTAAGTIVAFGTIYAAHALYDFIGPALAFVLLGATGIATMLAAALHGPALAGLGLAGAMATPLLVSSNAPNYWSLVLYFAVVAASAYTLARTRSWLWLALSTVVGAALWGLLMTGRVATLSGAGAATFADPATAHGLLQLALAAGFLAYEPHVGKRDQAAMPDWVAGLALAIGSFVIVACLAASGFYYGGWIPAATLAIAILTVTGWVSAPAAVAMLLAGAIALAALALWPGLQLPPDKTLLAPYAAQVLRLPDNVSSYLAFSALWTLPPAAIAAYRIWRGSLLPVPTAAIYALGATIPPLLALILAYLRITQFDVSIPFALGGALLALMFGIAADRFQKADQAYTVPAYNLATGAFAAAAIAGLAFALVVSMSRGYLTVALALTALGSAYVSSLRDIALLRHVVTALGGLVILRLAWDPRIMGDGVGLTPVFNWLLIGYGVPALSFAAAAHLLEKRGDDISVRISDALAVVFTGLFAFFEIRHLTNHGDVFNLGTGHVETGLMTLVALGLSFVLARLNLGKRNPVFDAASTVFGAGSVAFAAIGLATFANPYFTNQEIGGRTIFSSLLLGYLIPGLAALYVARHARAMRPLWYIRAAGILAVVLIFAYVTLEVRHAFQGNRIGLDLGISDAERWAHSVAWLLLGIAFLAYGLLRGSLEARIASAILVTLTAVKVTIFDLAGIGGLWRALSFICLGAVLIGIGLVYQKYIVGQNVPRKT